MYRALTPSRLRKLLNSLYNSIGAHSNILPMTDVRYKASIRYLLNMLYENYFSDPEIEEMFTSFITNWPMWVNGNTRIRTWWNSSRKTSIVPSYWDFRYNLDLFMKAYKEGYKTYNLNEEEL